METRLAACIVCNQSELYCDCNKYSEMTTIPVRKEEHGTSGTVEVTSSLILTPALNAANNFTTFTGLQVLSCCHVLD